MATCQNGWPASPNRENIVAFSSGGVSFPGGVRSGDVATVLQYVADQWGKRVEKLVVGWCWAFAYREVRGGGSLSNHAGGYALDFNAPTHPLGKKGTYSAAQVKTILAILEEVDGVVRWGGSYSGRVDEMHVEIVGSPKAVAAVAARLRGKPAPAPGAPPPATGTLQRGSKGNAVAQLQKVLSAWYPFLGLAVDGDFGPATENAVKELQKRSGLVADGIAGPLTLGKLGLA